jgi:hypothetical protein
MVLQSVSIVNLVCPTPAAVGSPTIARLGDTEVRLTWPAVEGSDHYEVWSATNQPYFTPGADCANPAPLQCTSVADTLVDSGAGSPTGSHTYAVRAINACGAASDPAPDRVGVFEYELAPGSQS